MLKNTQTSLAEEQERNRQLTKPVTAEKMETRKAELETNLATNLKRQKQEYEAIISSSETDLHENEAESKWQELKDTKSLVIDATQRLEGINRSTEETNKQIKKIKDEMAKLKALEDTYEKTLQDETKELEQLFSRRNTLKAKKMSTQKR
ncbi:structural maintenance of chromosomes protein 3-like [Syzygium oleosum]|uniref:structural maintenance of chromosomes protein 3-like n=1 Tax=Syzygium oleosum TaxID=219896 RepID=UPI0024BA4059|nr:structural maintenance of chromosomes protein 3-like [Syzygium oleosum]